MRWETRDQLGRGAGICRSEAEILEEETRDLGAEAPRARASLEQARVHKVATNSAVLDLSLASLSL